MNDLYLMKIGGSVITNINKPLSANRTAIKRLLKEIYSAKKENDFHLILGHGSGSFAHTFAKKYKVAEGLVYKNSAEGAILTHNAAQKLNNIVLEIGLSIGMPLYPFSASSFAVAENRKLIQGNLEGINNAIEKGFIPLVYGDVVIDKRQGVSIASTEEILKFISYRFGASKLIIGTNVDGVFDKNPITEKNAKMINLVNKSNIRQVIESSGNATKIDVTGGMKTKISYVYDIVKETKATGYIANASKPNVMKNLLIGNEKSIKCTQIRA